MAACRKLGPRRRLRSCVELPFRHFPVDQAGKALSKLMSVMSGVGDLIRQAAAMRVRFEGVELIQRGMLFSMSGSFQVVVRRGPRCCSWCVG